MTENKVKMKRLNKKEQNKFLRQCVNLIRKITKPKKLIRGANLIEYGSKPIRIIAEHNKGN